MQTTLNTTSLAMKGDRQALIREAAASAVSPTPLGYRHPRNRQGPALPAPRLPRTRSRIETQATLSTTLLAMKGDRQALIREAAASAASPTPLGYRHPRNRQGPALPAPRLPRTRSRTETTATTTATSSPAPCRGGILARARTSRASCSAGRRTPAPMRPSSGLPTIGVLRIRKVVAIIATIIIIKRRKEKKKKKSTRPIVPSDRRTTPRQRTWMELHRPAQSAETYSETNRWRYSRYLVSWTRPTYCCTKSIETMKASQRRIESTNKHIPVLT
ncbi:hypothetical protein B0T26DRAFT_310150 [Lasiosphaeria miniovina]|uniref:Uncharacterized protein n=1 Tax=Lasiosphaeria miniovina TaxID=1954250 RepID=A0AA40ALD9_9PEZI|nr:uncharacterized protein B0T26DRAFT_310150 [Lasiosphaeria miniovina]KAK0718001.1 hypothetical protein B0T26DRAFT_310150 [Lasiosphaeria miniovina]